MKIALFGGSFDPPHMAHQMACLYLLEAEGFERVWLIPTFKHVFSKPLAPFRHRVSMCNLVAKALGRRMVVSQVEKDLFSEQGNRTIDTVDHLKARHPDGRYTLVIGSDLLPETLRWSDFQRLRQEVSLLVLRRAGYLPTEAGWTCSSIFLPELSSTEVRRRLARGEAIHGLVPKPVRDYIERHALYAPIDV